LQAQGMTMGRHQVRSLMREANIRPVWKSKFVATTDSKHDMPVAGNWLDRQFEVAASNQAWVSDMTYIRTRSGWLYLAIVLDLYARKVVGWATAPTMPTTLVGLPLKNGSILNPSLFKVGVIYTYLINSCFKNFKQKGAYL
jgi:putative transposase